MQTLRIGLYQMNAWVGDLDRNVQTILTALEEARARGVDVVAFPELSALPSARRAGLQLGRPAPSASWEGRRWFSTSAPRPS